MLKQPEDLECKIQTLSTYYKKLGINYKGNQGAKGVKISTRRKSALDIISNPNISNAKKEKKTNRRWIKGREM